MLVFLEVNSLSPYICNTQEFKGWTLDKWEWKVFSIWLKTYVHQMCGFVFSKITGETLTMIPIGSMYYLHVPYKSTKCRQIYHTWILWDWNNQVVTGRCSSICISPPKLPLQRNRTFLAGNSIKKSSSSTIQQIRYGLEAFLRMISYPSKSPFPRHHFHCFFSEVAIK